MNSTPRFSVLLPTHNRADVLGFAIQSVLWQSESDYELLIVGDGCTDDTRDVVASFTDPRIRFFDLPKAPFGGYANRNIALRAARGHYIAYAQDDDIFFPDHLSMLGKTVAGAGVQWGYSRPLWVTPDGFVLPFATNLTNADELAAYLTIDRNHVPSTFVLHTRDALARVGYWPENVAKKADLICWRRIIENGGRRTAYCGLATVLHFQSVTNRGARSSSEVGPSGSVYAQLSHIAKNAKWWPRNLKSNVPAGTTEQEIFFNAMKAGGSDYCAQLRASVALVIDRLAWSYASATIIRGKA